MSETPSPVEEIDRYIAETEDWRGDTLAACRKAILAADDEIVEEFKWMGSPVWEHSGLLRVGNAHKAKVKLTFAYGAHLPDPDKLFNGKDTGATRRYIDVFEGDQIDSSALTEFIRTAIAYNLTHLKKNAKK